MRRGPAAIVSLAALAVPTYAQSVSAGYVTDPDPNLDHMILTIANTTALSFDALTLTDVAANVQFRPHLAQILHEVISKRVVVVNHKYHGCALMPPLSRAPFRNRRRCSISCCFCKGVRSTCGSLSSKK